VSLATDEIHFYYLKDISPGYIWAFPVGDGLVNLGMYLFVDHKRRRGSLASLFERLLAEPPLAEWLRGAERIGRYRSWSLPLAGDAEPLHGDGFVLVGDAAGLVDPLWGHGIDTAMVSAKLAGTAIADAFAERISMNDAMKGYGDAVRGAFQEAWQLHRSLRDQLATLNALLGGTPLEHLQRAFGARDAVIQRF
jgi:flavin-dependent dehydrogenase